MPLCNGGVAVVVLTMQAGKAFCSPINCSPSMKPLSCHVTACFCCDISDGDIAVMLWQRPMLLFPKSCTLL
jgi:hypothetical protein